MTVRDYLDQLAIDNAESIAEMQAKIDQLMSMDGGGFDRMKTLLTPEQAKADFGIVIYSLDKISEQTGYAIKTLQDAMYNVIAGAPELADSMGSVVNVISGTLLAMYRLKTKPGRGPKGRDEIMLNDPNVREYLAARLKQFIRMSNKGMPDDVDYELRANKLSGRQCAWILKQLPELSATVSTELVTLIDLLAQLPEPETAQDIPAEYARLKAKYGDTFVVDFKLMGNGALITVSASARVHIRNNTNRSAWTFLEKCLKAAGKLESHELHKNGGVTYLCTMNVICAVTGGSVDFHDPGNPQCSVLPTHVEYLLLKAYDELHAGPDDDKVEASVQATEDQIATEGELPLKSAGQIMDEALIAPIKRTYKYDPAATAALKEANRVAEKENQGQKSGWFEDRAQNMKPSTAGIDLSKYDPDLRLALMNPPGSFWREMAIKTQAGRGKKGE